MRFSPRSLFASNRRDQRLMQHLTYGVLRQEYIAPISILPA